MLQSICPHTTKVDRATTTKLGTKLIFNDYSTQPNLSNI